MKKLTKILFFAFFVKPIVFVVLGLNIRGKNNLPTKGPAIIAANHNSHLDALVLMSLFPLSQLHKIRPAAAADYFLKNRFYAWLSLKCIDIIPLQRNSHAKKSELFAACHQALDMGDIVILFPEGSRGLPEEMGTIKRGLFHIVNDRTDTQITPIILHGLGRSLPRGEALLVPFNCDVIIGEVLPKTNTATQFVEEILKTFEVLQQYCVTRN
jgi:1-acyl-sn-glycerol-3-phosphate acyltransferase